MYFHSFICYIFFHVIPSLNTIIFDVFWIYLKTFPFHMFHIYTKIKEKSFSIKKFIKLVVSVEKTYIGICCDLSFNLKLQDVYRMI